MLSAEEQLTICRKNNENLQKQLTLSNSKLYWLTSQLREQGVDIPDYSKSEQYKELLSSEKQDNSIRSLQKHKERVRCWHKLNEEDK